MLIKYKDDRKDIHYENLAKVGVMEEGSVLQIKRSSLLY